MRVPSLCRLFVLAPVVFTLAAGCGVTTMNPFDPGTPAEVQARARLAGTVRGRTTDGTAPLTGATISLEGPVRVAPATTDAAGAYSFGELLPGQWTLVIAHPTHLTQLRELTLLAGFERALDVTLDPLPAAPGNDAGRLTGHALRSGELARPEAERDHSGIVVEVEGAGIRTVTAPDGAFDLFLRPGTYNLVFSARNYNLSRRNGIALAASETVTVPDDPVVLDANPGSVAGRVSLEGVTGTDGLDGVAVSVTGATTTQTAPDGTYRLTGIAAGAYPIQFTKAGFDTLTVLGVTVEGGRESSVPDQRLALSRGSIRGVARFSDRSDHSGIAISLAGTAIAVATTPAGAFVIERIAVGTYELVASSNGYTRGQAAAVTVTSNGVTDVGTLTLVRQQGDFEINDGAASTRARDVSLALLAPGAAQMRVSEDPTFADAALGDTAYESFDPAPTHRLTEGDGEKVVFVQVRDAQGTESGVLEGRIVLDTTPPEGTSLLLDRGASYSRDAAGRVELALAANDPLSGVQAVQLSNDATFDEPFEPWTTSKAHVLADPLTDGRRTVYARFRDGAGNVSLVAAEATITLDRAPPALARFSIDCEGRSDATHCRSSLVTLTLEASGASRMILSNTAGFPGDVQEPVAATRAWLLEPGDGLRTVHLQLVDDAGNRSLATSDTVIIDALAPSSPFVRIEQGTQVRTLAVTATLGAVGADEMRIDLRSAAGDRTEGVWQAFATSASVTLPAGVDGARRVEAQFRDLAGNTSDLATATVTVDREAPAGGSVSFEATHVNATAVVARLDAVGATQHRVSTDGLLDAEPWFPFARTQAVVLPTGDGSKLILAEFRDEAGNVSAAAQTTLVLDTGLPTGAVELAGGASATPSPLVSVAFTGVSIDVVELQVAADSAFAGAGWIPFTTTTTWNFSGIDGARTLYARFRDRAGNQSAPVSDGIDLDRTAPTAGTVSLSPSPYTRVAAATLTITGAGASQMRVDLVDADGTRLAGAWETFATTRALTLPTTLQGAKRVEVAFRDAAGNEGPNAGAQTLYDTVAPAGLSATLAEGALVPGRSVTLRLEATGADELQVAVDGTADTEAWETFVRTRAAVLVSGDGAKAVAVRVRDLAGNVTGPVTVATTLDTGIPGGSVTIAGGASHSGTALVSLAFTGVASDVTELLASNDSGFSGANWQAYASTLAWTLTGADGTKTVYARFRDGAGNLSSIVNDAITLDTAAPTSPSISLPATAKVAAVTATLSAVAADQMRLTVVDTDGTRTEGAFETYATTKGLTLPITTQGSKRVEATYRDLAGNLSSTVFAQLTFDNVAPTGTAISIASEATWSTTSAVTVTLAATGATQMRVAADGVLNSESWESYAQSKAITLLPSGGGLRTVLAEFRDDALNTTTAVSDAITVDATAPTGSITIDGGTASTRGTLITLTLTRGDSDTSSVQVSADPAFAGAAWQDYSATVPFTLASTDGTKTVYARFRDAAGNVSTSTYSDTIDLDTTGPSSPSLAIDAGADTATPDVRLSPSAAGAVEMNIANRVSFSTGDGATGWIPIADRHDWTLDQLLGDGTKDVYAKFRDGLGNESAVAVASTVLDTTAPDLQRFTINGGDAWTRLKNVALDLTAFDAGTGVTEVYVSRDGSYTDGAWQTFAKSMLFDLHPGAGAATTATHSLAVKVRDAVGNLSTELAAAITHDVDAPVVTVVAFSEGAIASSSAVRLSVTASDVSPGTLADMQISENAGFTGAQWETFTDVVSRTLSSNNGPKSVWVKVRDAAGLVSAPVQSATLELDTVAPRIDSAAFVLGAATSTLTLDLRVTAWDNLATGSTLKLGWAANVDQGTRAGCDALTYASSFTGCNASPCTASFPVVLEAGADGPRTISACVQDAAGNFSPIVTSSITYDTLAPEIPTGLVANGTSRQILASWSEVADAGSGLSRYDLRYGEMSGNYTTLDAALAETLSISNLANRHQYRLNVRAVDGAGNASAWSPEVTAIVGFGAGRLRTPFDRTAALDRSPVVAGGYLWLAMRRSTTVVDVWRCEIARDDCRQPDSWTRLGDGAGLFVVPFGRTVASTPALSATNERIWVAFHDSLSATDRRLVAAFCSFRTADCSLAGSWTRVNVDTSNEAISSHVTSEANGGRLYLAYAREAAGVTYPTVAWCPDTRSCALASDWFVSRVNVSAGPARAFNFAAGYSISIFDGKLYVAYPALNATNEYGLGLLYCSSGLCRYDTSFESHFLTTTGTSSSLPRIIRTRESLYLFSEMITSSTRTVVGGRCSDQSICTSAASWTFETGADTRFIPASETGGKTTQFALAAQGGTALHATYWLADTGEVRFATCDMPGVTDCTKSSSWRKLVLETNASLVTAPSIALFGSQPVVNYVDDQGYLRTQGPRFATPSDFGAGPGIGALRAAWTSALYVDGYDVTYDDDQQAAPAASVAPYNDPLAERATISATAEVLQSVLMHSVKDGEAGDDGRLVRVRPFSEARLTPQLHMSTLCEGTSSATCSVFTTLTAGARPFILSRVSGSGGGFLQTCTVPADCANPASWTGFSVLDTGVSGVFGVGLGSDGTRLVAVGRLLNSRLVLSTCLLSSGCDEGTDFTPPILLSTNWSEQGALDVVFGGGRFWIAGTRTDTNAPMLLSCASSGTCGTLAQWTSTAMASAAPDLGSYWTTVGSTGVGVVVLRETGTTLRQGFCTHTSGCNELADFSWSTIRTAMTYPSVPGRTRLAAEMGLFRYFVSRQGSDLVVGYCDDTYTFGCGDPLNWTTVPIARVDATSGYAANLVQKNDQLWVAWQSLNETFVAYCGTNCQSRDNWMSSPSFRNPNLREPSYSGSFFGLTGVDQSLRLYMAYQDDQNEGSATQMRFLSGGAFTATD